MPRKSPQHMPRMTAKSIASFGVQEKKRKLKQIANRRGRGISRPFRLEPVRDGLTWDEFQAYPFLIFFEPERKTYKGHGGSDDFDRFRVRVANPNKHVDYLGYLPLPTKYYEPWVNLCYIIVYHRNAFITLHDIMEESDSEETLDAITPHFCSVAAVLKYHIYCRGKIIAEILGMKGQLMEKLPTFDEYIIKNRFDYSWDDDDEARIRPFIFKDPFSKDMKFHMRPYIIFPVRHS